MIEIRFNNFESMIEYEHERKIFSGGEIQAEVAGFDPHISVDEGESVYKITLIARLCSSDDIMELLMVTDALRRLHGDHVGIHAIIPYFPYARQDRVCAPGEALGARVMADLINAQQYETVTLWDAHSDVTTALLDRSTSIGPDQFIGNIVTSGTILVAPDAGAIKRVSACARKYGLDLVRADKSRDTRTNEIKDTIVYSEHVGDRDFLIIDDICDGGRTFIELAKKLRPLTTGKINLYVTHGIFSYGVEVFDGIIDEVFVKNPWPNVLLTDESRLRFI